MDAWRVSLLKSFIFLLFFGVVLRLVYWQFVVTDSLKAKAESQRTSSTKTLGQRGNILFNDGSILVGSQFSYLLFAEKKQIDNAETLSKALAPTVGEEEASLSAKLNQDLLWIPLVRQLPAQKKLELEKQNLKGIGFDRKETRFYPEASMAASLLGFVGKDTSGKDKGYFGLEGYYNLELQGKEGVLQQERDVSGRPILTAQSYETMPKRGHTLVLYLDRAIQYIAEQKLKEGVEKYQAASGDVVIMDPFTGGILGLAVYPAYNPVEYYKSPQENYKNPVVADSYEPGSTFKTVVMASAIDGGAVKPQTTCPVCGKPREVGGFTIRNWDNTYRADTTMNDVLKNSDNNGMMFVGDRLGKNKLLEYIEKFGIGKTTKIDLQDEESPQLREKNSWYEVDYATATFGQGIAVTPIQLVRAVAVLANGGKLIEPHMVKKIITPEKEVEIKPKVLNQVISEKAAKIITDMLVYTVDNGEAGRLFKPKGFVVAGKSGTAQVALSGKYAQGKTIASYIGYAPIDNPRFVMLVRLREPKAGIHGATTAAPIFYAIAKELFAYWGITPRE